MSANETVPESEPGAVQHSPATVVGVGASAGGLAALEEFFAGVADAGDTAFVVAQHLAPGHPSLLVDLLGRSSPLPVVEAHDGAALRGGVIVVAPPHRDVVVAGGELRVFEPPERFGPSPRIDALFESLAADWGSHAVAVILSGTGADGALGMRAVKANGGLCLVQSPDTAEFSGMPRAAIALGGSELVADAAELGARVSGLAHSVSDAHAPTRDPDLWLETLSNRLKQVTGIDFDRYKRSSVERQVQRRMAMRQVAEVGKYVDLLAEDPDECQALSNALLVSVTSFFRDPLAFDALARQIDEYIKARRPGVLRVWVPGCATGEEVYSIGMLVGEALGFPADLSRRLKIFGTDLDETSLSIARRASYPSSALEHIPEGLRARYTRPAPDGFRIVEVLRECTVFARQDVGHDPPFPQVDLLSCRNTLIYFADSLQRDVMSLFAFALNPGGILFLGRAESLHGPAGLFDVVDAERRIFRRTSEVVIPTVSMAARPARQRVSRTMPAGHASPALDEGAAGQVSLLEAILRSSGQSYLVMDADDHLVHVVGDVSPYCQVPEGHVTAAGGSFLRAPLQAEARALMLLGHGQDDIVHGQFLPVDDLVVQLSVFWVEVAQDQFTVLALRQVDGAPETTPPGPERGEDFDRELQRLDRELQAARDVLRRSMAELQGANQELEASTEELQSSLEELQSTNEELQASNEELEATNEELATANQEQRARGDELERANLDLWNIQAAVSQGMVIVDRDLRITRFTPMAVQVFALEAQHIGGSLLAVPTTPSLPGLDDALRRVMSRGVSEAIEIAKPEVPSHEAANDADSASAHYLLHLLPYIGRGGACIGAIMTLTDVSELVVLRDEAEDALARLQEKTQLLTRRATVDEVTGISNRAYFTESLAREIDRCGRAHDRLALAWIDLDRFKEVNDGLGHEAGDTTLRETADRLRGLVRGTDLVGRLGGDEFGVLLSGPENFSELDVILERLTAALHEPIRLAAGEARIAASIGVAVFPTDAGDAEALLRSADAAMYAIKNRGGDGFAYFDQSMNEQADQRRFMRHRISRGVEQGAFSLHFQPVVSVDGDSVWGLEALMRWHDAGRLRSAAEFIEFAEESGQIRQLGSVTLAGARRAIAAVSQGGFPDARMAVNLSVTQLADPALVDMIRQWFVPGGLPGIVIEVVESLFLPDHRHAMDALRDLAAMGAQVSIDDFGAGYSNYRLLESLSPDFIKLDKSFLRTAHDRAGRLALMNSAVQLAHVVGAEVIAEGVEDDEDVALAREAGADYLQGFAIAGAMPLEEALAWLADRRAGGEDGG